jgi:hypothetical protein
MPSSRPLCTLAALVLALVAIAPPRAYSTSIVLPSIQDLTNRSDLIVIATAQPGAVASWDDDHRFIVTRTTLIVGESLYGAATPGGMITVETLGGFIAAEDKGLMVPGAPELRAGEEVLLFLATDARGIRRTVDLAAGKFEILGTGAGRAVTRTDLGAADVRGSGQVAPQTLDELRAAIADAVATRNARERSTP